jgi:hypothetical protein
MPLQNFPTQQNFPYKPLPNYLPQVCKQQWDSGFGWLLPFTGLLDEQQTLCSCLSILYLFQSNNDAKTLDKCVGSSQHSALATWKAVGNSSSPRFTLRSWVDNGVIFPHPVASLPLRCLISPTLSLLSFLWQLCWGRLWIVWDCSPFNSRAPPPSP